MTKTKKLVSLIGETDSVLSAEDREKVMDLAAMIEQIERNISRSLQFYASQCNLTLLDAQSLAAILELNEGARLSAIAEYVHMPLSTMTGVAARLERSGLVERKRATDDGRAYVLSLTDAGQARIHEMFQPFFLKVSQVIEGTGAETLQTLVESFAIVNTMSAQLGSVSDDQN